MANITSNTQARKRGRGAQIKANEARIERERRDVDHAHRFWSSLGARRLLRVGEPNRVQEVLQREVSPS